MTRKLLVISSTEMPPISGTDVSVFRRAAGLAKKGFQVAFSCHMPRTQRGDESFNVIYRPFYFRYAHKAIQWVVRIYAEALRVRGFDVLQFEYYDLTTLLFSLMIFRPIGRHEVVVFHDRIWPCHPRKTGGFRGSVELLLHRLVIGAADTTVVAGEDIKEWFKQLHGEWIDGKIEVLPVIGVPSAVPRSCTEGKTELIKKLGLQNSGVDESSFVTMFLGHMLFRPNLESAMYTYRISDALGRSFKESTGRDLRVLVAGKGSEWLPKTSTFIPVGFVENLWEYVALIDAFLLPMLPSHSGPHMKTLFALSTGKPVITTPDGVKGLLDVGDSSVVVVRNYNDLESITHSLVRLAQDPDYYDRLSIESRECASKFSWDRVIDLWIELYESLIDSRIGRSK